MHSFVRSRTASVVAAEASAPCCSCTLYSCLVLQQSDTLIEFTAVLGKTRQGVYYQQLQFFRSSDFEFLNFRISSWSQTTARTRLDEDQPCGNVKSCTRKEPRVTSSRMYDIIQHYLIGWVAGTVVCIDWGMMVYIAVTYFKLGFCFKCSYE